MALFTLAWSLSATAWAAGQSDGLASELEAFFQARADDGFSGLVLVSQGEEEYIRRAWGLAGCDGDALTTEHVILIGSITKPFTHATTHYLARAGALGLDDSIAAHLDGVPPDKQPVTIDMLLRHASGFPDIVAANGRPTAFTVDWDYLPVTRAEIVSRAMQSGLVFEPGSDRRYSNLGYSLLAAAIESVSGQPYERQVREAVFEPIGMRHTGYLLPDLDGMPLAHGCDAGENWPLPHSAARWMEDGPSWNLRGNGGMLSTLPDLERWLDALVNAKDRPGHPLHDYLARVAGESGTFGEYATVAAGGNGIINTYYLQLFDSDLRLVMMSNRSDNQAESHLDALFPILAAHTRAMR